jgi:hypothetical protein
MRRLLTILGLAVGLTNVDGAVACLPGLVAQSNPTVLAQSPCTVGISPVLTFSNWAITNQDGSTNQYQVSITSTTDNPTTISFFTNLDSFFTPATRDIVLSFTVTGGVNFASVQNAMSFATTIDEIICNVAPVNSFCPAQNRLWDSGLVNGGNSASASFALTNQIWVIKDIQAPSGAGTSFGFTEGFFIPEPMTFSLIGAGLLVLVAASRRLKAK